MEKRLDNQKKNDVFAILSVGGTRLMAAHYVGCHPRTIYNEARRDPEFARKLRNTEASPELSLLRTVIQAGTEGKKCSAATWALERLYPTRYGRRSPRMVSPEEVHALLEEVVESFARHVPGAASRERIRQVVEDLDSSVNSVPSSKRSDHDER